MNFDTLLSTPDSTMETTIFKYESYELLKNKNGEYMIIGYDQVLLKNNPKIRDAGEKVLMNSPSLLYAFIELYSKLGIKGGNRNEIEKQVSKNIEKIKPIIIDFCKEHGLPYYGNIGEYDIHNNFTYNPEDIFENNAFDKLRKDNNALAISFCNLSFFLYWLHILYRDFLWHITMTDQTDIIENFENNLKINMSKFKNARPKKKYFSQVL